MPLTRQQSRTTKLKPPVADENFVSKKRSIKSPNGLNNGAPPKKRAAFGDISNAFNNVVIDSSKKKNPSTALKKQPEKATSDCENVPRISSQELFNVQAGPSLSQGSSSSDSDTDNHSRGKEVLSEDAEMLSPKKVAVKGAEVKKQPVDGEEPDRDPHIRTKYDAENAHDIAHVAHYAHDIFEYYKRRERKFVVEDYLKRQKDLSVQMRAILIDWMVEVQENFELNHETLYQAVKMTDLYLAKVPITKQNLQLLGATTLFIASKFDERSPPPVDDFMYICDDAYTREEMLALEIDVLNRLDFDIGMPLSYRFLRRYAKATKASMQTLTLARYVLEMALMFYEYVHDSESRLAAAAYWLAIKMSDLGPWNEDHEFYSGFKESEIKDLAKRMNHTIKTTHSKHLQSVKGKYSHEVFFKVAEICPLEDAAFN